MGCAESRSTWFQQVGVAMFSTGNFKNVVGSTTIEINAAESFFADVVSGRISR